MGQLEKHVAFLPSTMDVLEMTTGLLSLVMLFQIMVTDHIEMEGNYL